MQYELWNNQLSAVNAVIQTQAALNIKNIYGEERVGNILIIF